MHFAPVLHDVFVDLEVAKALSMQEQQPSPAPAASYESIGDQISEESLTPLQSVSSWLNIPGKLGEATNWVDQSHAKSGESVLLKSTTSLLHIHTYMYTPTTEFSPPLPTWRPWNMERTAGDGATNIDHLWPPGTISRSTLPPANYCPIPNGDSAHLHTLPPLQVHTQVNSPSPETTLEHAQLSPTIPQVMDAKSSPTGSSNWGPLYGEEEDLRRAIQISVEDDHEFCERPQASQSGLSIRATQFLAYDARFDDGPHTTSINRADLRNNHVMQELSLPPELRYLLETSSRTGAHV